MRAAHAQHRPADCPDLASGRRVSELALQPRLGLRPVRTARRHPRGGSHSGAHRARVIAIASRSGGLSHRVLYGGDELLKREWLGEEIVITKLAVRQVFLERVFGITRHEDDL